MGIEKKELVTSEPCIAIHVYDINHTVATKTSAPQCNDSGFKSCVQATSGMCESVKGLSCSQEWDKQKARKCTQAIPVGIANNSGRGVQNFDHDNDNGKLQCRFFSS